MKSNEIPFLSFDKTNKQIEVEIKQSFDSFFESKWYVLGSRVNKFEKEFALFNETNHCIGVSNGLDAIHLSLKAFLQWCFFMPNISNITRG